MPLSIDIIRQYKDDEVADAPTFLAALEEVALVLLHREIERHGLVTLNQTDFEAFEALISRGLVSVQLNYDENTGEVLVGEIAVEAAKHQN